MQPSANKLGGSYIMEGQVTQVENVSCNTSISNADVVMQEYLKNHFNKWLNDKVYNTFKELFEGINIDSMKEALPKVSIYNNFIVKFVDKINSKYGTALTFTILEPHEVGHWAKTFQMVCGNSKAPKSPGMQQTHEEHHSSVQPQSIQQWSQTVTDWQQQLVSQPVTDQHLTPSSLQVLQEEINRLHKGQLATSKG